MSEWDYLPTPYETLIENETKNSLLSFMSLCCLCNDATLTPTEIFIISINDKSYKLILDEIVNKSSIQDVIRTFLKYEDLRGEKKREKVIEIFRQYVK